MAIGCLPAFDDLAPAARSRAAAAVDRSAGQIGPLRDNPFKGDAGAGVGWPAIAPPT